MKKIIVLGLLVLFSASCENNSAKTATKNTHDSVVVTKNNVKIDSLKTKISQNENPNDAMFASNVNIVYEPSGRIQAVYQSNWGYREMSRTEIPSTSNIIGLFCVENNAYYLKQTKITFKDDVDDCSGDATLSLVSEAKFLFLNFTNYNKNKIQSILLKDREMLPNEKFTFDFGSKQYELEAFGEKGIDEYNVKNYSLVYSIKGMTRKQTIVNIPKIEGTSVQLLFIGDLDGDGKPDIILNAPSNYENQIIMVFLSSTAKKGDYLRCEAQKSDWFDC